MEHGITQSMIYHDVANAGMSNPSPKYIVALLMSEVYQVPSVGVSIYHIMSKIQTQNPTGELRNPIERGYDRRFRARKPPWPL